MYKQHINKTQNGTAFERKSYHAIPVKARDRHSTIKRKRIKGIFLRG
jgi:hypothetical protein